MSPRLQELPPPPATSAAAVWLGGGKGTAPGDAPTGRSPRGVAHTHGGRATTKGWGRWQGLTSNLELSCVEQQAGFLFAERRAYWAWLPSLIVSLVRVGGKQGECLQWGRGRCLLIRPCVGALLFSPRLSLGVPAHLLYRRVPWVPITWGCHLTGFPTEPQEGTPPDVSAPGSAGSAALATQACHATTATPDPEAECSPARPAPAPAWMMVHVLVTPPAA